MKIELEIWQLIIICMTFFGFVAGCAKLLLNQINHGLDARFLAMEKARSKGEEAMKEAIRKNTDAESKITEKLNKLEISFLEFQAKLPTEYVRHPDYVRQESKIESKLDALYNIITARGINQ